MCIVGNKVEVRIITAGYYNSDDDTLHILSEEDSTAFNKMIVTILVSTVSDTVFELSIF